MKTNGEPRNRFEEAFAAACVPPEVREGIGRLNEGTLHRTLKYYFEPDITRHELKIGRFVADIVNADGITEIQTRAFNNMRGKLEDFLSVGRVTVVFPIAAEKYLEWCDPITGELKKPRKSPRKGNVFDIFPELYKIKMFLNNPALAIKLIMLRITDRRELCGWDESRKKGSYRIDRIPSAVFGEITLSSPYDYAELLPVELNTDGFTVKELARAAKIRPSVAGTVMNVMKSVNAVTVTGKGAKGAYIYKKTV